MHTGGSLLHTAKWVASSWSVLQETRGWNELLASEEFTKFSISRSRSSPWPIHRDLSDKNSNFWTLKSLEMRIDEPWWAGMGLFYCLIHYTISPRVPGQNVHISMDKFIGKISQNLLGPMSSYP